MSEVLAPETHDAAVLDRAARAREAHQRKAARRRASDPGELAKAFRTVGAAVDAGGLDPDVVRAMVAISAKPETADRVASILARGVTNATT